MSVTQSRSGSLRAKLSIDEVAGGRLVRDPPVPRSARTGPARPARRISNDTGFGTDRDAVPEGELGVHAPRAVDAAAVEVDLAG